MATFVVKVDQLN